MFLLSSPIKPHFW